MSFFQRSIPEELFSRSATTSDISPPPSSSRERDQTDPHHTNDKASPLHTEVKVHFERLGIRLLRRRSSLVREAPPPSSTSSSSSARLVAKIMLYGLSVQGTISSDVAIDGRLDGVQVTDLTPQSKKYSNIVHLGVGGAEVERDIGRLSSTSSSGLDELDHQRALSFSISRSARPLTSLSGARTPPSDVTLRLFVPSIHYTHSVNFVYEMEMFVSDLKFYSSKLAESMRSAAVGVAKGFVSKESHLARGLGRLHSSFGYTSASRNSFSLPQQEDAAGEEVEEMDGEGDQKVADRIFLKVSVQSPVIVLPSSLAHDKCLVAHLGKIVVENEFIPEDLVNVSRQTDLAQSVNTTSLLFDSSSPEIERLTLTVSNISLHASQTKEGREWLESAQSEELSLSPESCFKVLKESSISVQIDKRLSRDEQDSVDLDVSDTSLLGDEGANVRAKADVVITGRICNSLLIVLPKEVFDQIRSTLKHGIRRKPPSSFSSSSRRTKSFTSKTAPSENRPHKTVSFASTPTESKGNAAAGSMPKVYASFSLPRLSLELQQTLDEKKRSLVYVSLDDFSLCCHRLDPHITSFDVALKSIVIEDLLQPKDSEYRNILASSVKPLPFISPIPTPSRSLQRLSSAPGLSLSFTRHLFPIMSTPRPPASSDSPLRSFDPSESSVNRDYQSSILGSKIGNETMSSEDASQSTIKEESVLTGTSEVGGDLLTIRGEFVETRCPVFASKYNSVSCVK